MGESSWPSHAGLGVVMVWMIASLVHVSVYMNVVFFTSVDMAMFYLVQDGGGVAEKVPVMGDNDLIKV